MDFRRVLFFLFLFFAGICGAQDIVFREVKFQYLQLPLRHAGKHMRSYNSHIVLRYLENNADSKMSVGERKKKAEEDYEKEILKYRQLDRQAQKEYEAKMAEWDQKTVSEKLTSEKPKKKNVPLPYKRMPIEEKYMKQVDTAALVEKYLKLEGFEKSMENAVKITVFLLGFECSEPKIFEKEYTKLASNHQTERYMKYRYAIKYRHPAGFRVEDADGTILMEEYPAEFNGYVETATPEFENKANLEKLWVEKKEEFLNIVQKEILEKNLKFIGERINEYYGYRTIDYTTELGLVDEKKDYFDLKEAYGAALAGYNSFKTDLFKGEAKERLKEAVEKWENAYKEADFENKKARIDRGVSEMILLNLAEACMWMDDFTKAQAYLNKLFSVDPDKKNLKRAEKIRDLMPKLKERWEAN